MANSNPAPEHRFKKGDQRINRGGRPKDAVSLSALVRRIGHEKATTKDGQPVLGPDGKPMTVLEVVIRQRFQDKRYQGDMLDRGWGKVPDRIAGPDGGPVRTVTEVVIGGSASPGQQATGAVLDEQSA